MKCNERAWYWQGGNTHTHMHARARRPLLTASQLCLAWRPAVLHLFPDTREHCSFNVRTHGAHHAHAQEHGSHSSCKCLHCACTHSALSACTHATKTSSRASMHIYSRTHAHTGARHGSQRLSAPALAKPRRAHALNWQGEQSRACSRQPQQTHQRWPSARLGQPTLAPQLARP